MAKQLNPKFVNAAVIALLLFSGSLLVFIAHSKAIAWDEPTYIGGGYYYLKTADPRLVVGIPLNTMILGGAPLLVLNPPLPDNAESYVDISYVKFGYDFLFSGNVNVDQILFLSRLPFIGIFLLLGIFIFRWASELYGKKSGLFALFLYAFSPTILAHSAVVIADLILAAFGFISIYYFWRFVKNPARRNLFFSALFFGLALNSKTNAVFYILIYFALFFAVWLYKKQPQTTIFFRLFKKPTSMEYGKSFIAILLLFLIVSSLITFVSYGFQFAPIEDSVPSSYIERGKVVAESNFGSLAPFITKLTSIPIPFPTYIAGFVVQSFVASSVGIKKSFMFGEIYSGGKWQYFFAELFLKTPLSFILLLALSFFYFKRIKQDNLSELFLILPPLIYLLLFLPNSVNSGVRHLLLLYLFMFVFVSKLVNLKLQKSKRIAFAIVLVLLSLWYLISSLTIFPHYFAYFNEVVGPENGYKYFVGSNLDWGQDIKSLKVWMNENGVEHIKLSYFGTNDPSYYNISYDYLPSPVWQPWVPDYTPLEDQLTEGYTEDCSPKTGIIAISATNLQNVYLLNENCFDWLKAHEPIEKIGYSIFIYNITG